MRGLKGESRTTRTTRTTRHGECVWRVGSPLSRMKMPATALARRVLKAPVPACLRLGHVRNYSKKQLYFGAVPGGCLPSRPWRCSFCDNVPRQTSLGQRLAHISRTAGRCHSHVTAIQTASVITACEAVTRSSAQRRGYLTARSFLKATPGVSVITCFPPQAVPTFLSHLRLTRQHVGQDQAVLSGPALIPSSMAQACYASKAN